MRVTDQSRINMSLLNIERRSRSFADAQRQVSTGYRVQKASDDPAASARIVKLRGAMARNVQFQRNMDTARIRLGHAELSLSRVSDQLDEVRAFAVQAATDTYTPEDRMLLADEIDQLLESLVSEGNRRFLGNSLYAGSRVDGDAFAVTRDDAGQIVSVMPTVSGAPGSINIQLDENESVEVSFAGRDVFQGGEPGGDEDLFRVLIDLRDGLAAGSSEAPEVALEYIDAAISNVNSARAALGTRMNRVEQVEIQLFAREETLTENLSVEEDADLAEAVMKLNLEQVGYQAALQSVTQLMSTNLLQFLS